MWFSFHISGSDVSDSLQPHQWYLLPENPLTVHGILQARIVEWVDIPFSGDLPNLGIKPRSPTVQADSLPAEPLGEPNSALMTQDFYGHLEISSIYHKFETMNSLILWLQAPSVILPASKSTYRQGFIITMGGTHHLNSDLVAMFSLAEVPKLHISYDDWGSLFHCDFTRLKLYLFPWSKGYNMFLFYSVFCVLSLEY